MSAKIALDRGLLAERILIDRTSTSTIENLQNARNMMAAGDKAIIVTDRFHSKRALMLANKIGMNASVIWPDNRYPKSRTSVYVKGWLREIIAIVALLVLPTKRKLETTR